MKGHLSLKMLEFIKDFADFNTDFCEAFFRSGYGASFGKLDYEFNQAQKRRHKNEIEKEQKKKYYDLLYRLSKDGLIEAQIKNNKKIFALTKKGEDKLGKLANHFGKNLLPPNHYESEKGDKFILVIFDIPEKERRKRDWVRESLKNMGLKLAQKSVWLGKVKIPRSFLRDLHNLKLVDYVEIFEISKTGSLEKLI